MAFDIDLKNKLVTKLDLYAIEDATRKGKL